MSQLSWRHHTLIQALLSRGPLKESEFHKIFKEITGRDPVGHQEIFNDFLRKINKELGYVKFELRGCRNQYDGKVCYGIVNTLADDQSKLGTKYSVPQIAYYKAVIEAIVQDITTQGCITNIEALNLRLENQFQVPAGQEPQGSQSQVPAAFKNFSISQKEKTLSDLIQDKWLCSTPDGRIGLGVRSFLDLRSWFRINEIPSCDVCNEAGVKAATCSNIGCPIRIHEYCLKKKFSQRKAARVCPGCGTAWSVPEFYEEEEEEANELGQGNVHSDEAVTRDRLRRVKGEAVDAAADDGPSRPASGPIRNRRLRSCKAEAVESVQAEETEERQSSPAFRGARRSQRSRRS